MHFLMKYLGIGQAWCNLDTLIFNNIKSILFYCNISSIYFMIFSTFLQFYIRRYFIYMKSMRNNKVMSVYPLLRSIKS